MIWDFPYSCKNYLANHRAPYLACGDRDSDISDQCVFDIFFVLVSPMKAV